MHAMDTTVEAAAVQYEGYRRMGSSGRFQAAAELTNLVRDLARAGIRHRHPAYDAGQVSKELARILYRSSADGCED